MNKVLLAVIAIIAIVALYMIINNQSNTSDTVIRIDSNSPQPIDDVDPANDGFTSSIKLAMLDNEGTSGGKMRGCDRVVLVDRSIPTTAAPLSAALSELFSIEDAQVSGWMNFMTKTNDTLFFDKAVVENGIASIYLTGKLTGLAGVCDNPRARIQIEETAFQFPTVTGVLIFLNGEPTTLEPNESGM